MRRGVRRDGVRRDGIMGNERQLWTGGVGESGEEWCVEG